MQLIHSDRKHTFKHLRRRLLTQTAVAEILAEADVAQLAGRDLSNLQSHGGALAHRLHPHAHRLHLQHQHRHLQHRGDTNKVSVGVYISFTASYESKYLTMSLVGSSVLWEAALTVSGETPPSCSCPIAASATLSVALCSLMASLKPEMETSSIP